MSKIKKYYNFSTVILLFTMFLTGYNFYYKPQLYIANIFAVIYIVLIYYKYNTSINKLLYYLIILFSIINYSLSFDITSRYAVYFMYIYILLYAAKYIADRVKNNEFNKNYFLPLIKNKYSKFFVVFVLYMLFSTFIAKDKKMAISTIYVYVMMLSFLLIIINENRSKDELKKTSEFLTYIFIGVLIMGLIEVLGIRFGLRNKYTDMGIDINTVYYFNHIPTVFFYNPNDYAVYLDIVLCAICVNLIFENNTKKKYLLYLLFVLCQINIIFTASRIAWVCIYLIIGYLFAVGVINKNKLLFKRTGKIFIISLIIFFIFSIMPFSSIYYGKFNDTPILKLLNPSMSIKTKNENQLKELNKTIKIGNPGSDSERVTIYYDVLKGVFLEKNLLGFGPGNIKDYIKNQNNTFNVYNAHSMWLEILGDFGILIFAYYVFIYISMFLKSYKNYIHRNEKYSLMFSLMMFVLIFLTFAPSTVQAFVPFWIVIAMTICNIRIGDSN